MIRTGDDLKAARQALGWSLSTMAAALRLSGSREQGAKRIREMEEGIGGREVSGPISVAVEAMASGFRPQGFSERE